MGKLRMKLIMWLVGDYPVIFNVGLKLGKKEIKVAPIDKYYLEITGNYKAINFLSDGVEWRAKGFPVWILRNIGAPTKTYKPKEVTK